MNDKKITLFQAILMNINIMVGVGIFINPKLMAQKAGSLSYLGWPLVGLVFLPIVLGIAQIAELFPGAGSFYTYSKEGINKAAGFISGWLYFLGYVAIGATQLTVLRKDILINKVGLLFPALHPILFNALFYGVLCALNLFYLSLIGKIQSSLTFVKLLPILIVCLIFVFYWHPQLGIPQEQTLWDLPSTLPLAVFGFWGFEMCCNISHRIEGKPGSASRATLIGFFSTLLIYIVFHFGLLRLMGSQNLAVLGVPSFVDFVAPTLPMMSYALNVLLSFAFVATFVNGIYGMLTAKSFLLHTLAQEKLLFFSSYLQKTNRHDQPVAAIFASGFFAFLFATLINNEKILISISNFGILTSFLLTFTALLLYYIKHQSYGGILLAILSYISCSVLIGYSWLAIGNLWYTLPFFVIVFLGIAMYTVRIKQLGAIGE